MAERHKGSVVDEAAVHVTTVFSELGEHAVLDENATLDDKALAALGYKQEFKRYAHTPLYIEEVRPTHNRAETSPFGSLSASHSRYLDFSPP